MESKQSILTNHSITSVKMEDIREIEKELLLRQEALETSLKKLELNLHLHLHLHKGSRQCLSLLDTYV